MAAKHLLNIEIKSTNITLVNVHVDVCCMPWGNCQTGIVFPFSHIDETILLRCSEDANPLLNVAVLLHPVSLTNIRNVING